jgi:hypothetical protein
MRTSSYALTSLAEDDRPRWDKDFTELGTCLSIDGESITAEDRSTVTTGD